jgi:outer membrane protein TolC
MKPCKLLARWVAVLLLPISNLHAQDTAATEVIGLEEIWKAAEANNRQLKLSDLHLQQSKLEILEAKDRLLPELSLGGDVKLNSRFLLYNEGVFSSPQNIPVKSYGYGAGYNLNFNLFNGGKERINIRMKREQELRRQYEFQQEKHSVKYDIAVEYFDLYKFLCFRDFLYAEIAAENKQLSITESLHQNGVVLKSDVLRTSVKLSRLELNLSDIEKKIEIKKQRLNVLMGREQARPLAIDYKKSQNMETIQDRDYTSYLDTALSQSPELKLMDSEIKWSELNISQVKAGRLPKVSLYSNYNYTYPQISFYPYSNDIWGFGQTGIKVQFSLDNLYKSKHSIALARIISDEAKEKASLKKDEVSLQIKEAYLRHEQALESVETAEKNILKTTETLRVIRNSYLNQESLLTDLLDAENAVLEAKFDLTTAQINVQLSYIRILAVAGIL